MKNSIGTSLILTIFGESHGPYVGAVLDGLLPGMKVDEAFIKENLQKRRPASSIDTPRVENDNFEIISGVFNGYTTGAPLTIIIPNENINSNAYNQNYGLARPSHADYVAHVKYHGFEDYRGGGHFSGRITAAIVAAGSICLDYLRSQNIFIATHIKKCGNTVDRDFNNYIDDYKILNNKQIPVLNDIGNKIEQEILAAKNENDSIGGIVQTAILNLPVGLGEPWFDSFEGVIAKAMFSIGGVKGIEFGKGFGFAEERGSAVNDQLRMDGKKVVSISNNNGGVNGGITNGMPVVFNCAIKPTPSIAKSQQTINFIKQTEEEIKIQGRHDPAIIRRICIVITSLAAIVTCDELFKNKRNDL